MSQLVYGVLGASFLWPWNALLTASTLAKDRLVEQPRLYANYTSIVMTASTITSLSMTLYLAFKPQNYGARVKYGETIIAIAFMILGTTSGWSEGVSWMLLVVFVVAVGSLGTSLVQNGSLAITQRIPGPSHALALMNGQAVAGVLPPLLPFFASSTAISHLAPLTFLSVALLSLIAFASFSAKQNESYILLAEEAAEDEQDSRLGLKKLWNLAMRIHGPTVSILLGFVASLSYPVFANSVEPRSLDPRHFSPLAHLLWNSGDLVGRIICTQPRLRITNEKVMIAYSILRFSFIAVLIMFLRLSRLNDMLYLSLMIAYGITSGHLISSAIAHAPTCVPQNLQPATGGLIGLIISIGLLLGSMFSFLVVAVL